MPYAGAMTKKQFEEVDRRMADHENGIGRTYTWEEVNACLDNVAK